MAWYKKASDADLQQSMELASAAAKEAKRRGWTQGSGWKAGRR